MDTIHDIQALAPVSPLRPSPAVKVLRNIRKKRRQVIEKYKKKRRNKRSGGHIDIYA